MKKELDEIANLLWHAKTQLENVIPSLTGCDAIAAQHIAVDLAWAIENCTIIGLHQIGEGMDDDMGFNDVS